MKKLIANILCVFLAFACQEEIKMNDENQPALVFFYAHTFGLGGEVIFEEEEQFIQISRNVQDRKKLQMVASLHGDMKNVPSLENKIKNTAILSLVGNGEKVDVMPSWLGLFNDLVILQCSQVHLENMLSIVQKNKKISIVMLQDNQIQDVDKFCTLYSDYNIQKVYVGNDVFSGRQITEIKKIIPEIVISEYIH